MTEVADNVNDQRNKLSNQDSVFAPDSCTPPSEQEDDMFALYEQIDKLRGEFQKDFASKNPWFPILEELVRTEDQYLTDIDSIINSYVPKFEFMETEIPEIITPETSKVVFINLKEIRDFHKGFYQFLKPILAQESLKNVGKLFQDQAENFKIYSEYCSNHSNSVELLVKLRKHKFVDSCLKSVQTILQHPLNLSTYLLKPVQRVLKYKLLLQSMLKHAGDGTEEQQLLQSAADRMDSITKEINELKAISEGKQMLEEIHEGLDITPYAGPLIDYGNIHLQDTMLDLKAAKGRQERMVVLLDNALLICKVRENKRGTLRNMKSKRNAPFKFKDFIKLTELTFTLDDHIRSDDQAFLVHKQTGRLMTTYCLRARSIVKKNHWVSTLQDKVVASFNFAPDLLQQILGTLKYSASSLNSDSTNSPVAQLRSLTKVRMIQISPSADSMRNTDYSSDEDRRPYTMYDHYDYIDGTQSVPSFKSQTSEIICEKEDAEISDKVMFQVRKYSKTIDIKNRPRLPTPTEPIKLPKLLKGRDSGISDSQEYSNAEVKQQMRDLLCTMQQDYATFTDSTKERDSGVDEGEAPSQLDFLSLKRKHEGLVQSLVKNYMSAVSQQTNQPIPKQEQQQQQQHTTPKPLSGKNFPDKSQMTAGLLIPTPPPQSSKPHQSNKPPLSPKPSAIKKISAPTNKSKTLPRGFTNPIFPVDSSGREHSSSGSNSSFDPSSPVCKTSKVSGMKNHWEKTIDAHKEECKKI